MKTNKERNKSLNERLHKIVHNRWKIIQKVKKGLQFLLLRNIISLIEKIEIQKMSLHCLEKGVILTWLRKKHLKNHERYCL